MARNTNINELLFPVSYQSIYLENQNKPISGFKAITRDVGKQSEATISIVSDNYMLITNQEALDMGRSIHQRLFPNATTNSFEVFNIIAPKTMSSCHIDIIDKNYSINIGKSETYLPFVRIQNSYNRTRPLRFDIGFCRKLCNNGAIFEKGIVSINLIHSKHSFKGLDPRKIEITHLKKFEEDFRKSTQRSIEIKLPRKYFLPLAAKVLNRNFNLNEKDEYKRMQTQLKLSEFKNLIDNYTDKYIREQDLGETAYAFFNVITDYASNNNTLQAGAINGLQAKCGQWLNIIGTEYAKPEFNWEEEIEQYHFLMNYQQFDLFG